MRQVGTICGVKMRFSKQSKKILDGFYKDVETHFHSIHFL